MGTFCGGSTLLKQYTLDDWNHATVTKILHNNCCKLPLKLSWQDLSQQHNAPQPLTTVDLYLVTNTATIIEMAEIY